MQIVEIHYLVLQLYLNYFPFDFIFQYVIKRVDIHNASKREQKAAELEVGYN